MMTVPHTTQDSTALLATLRKRVGSLAAQAQRIEAEREDLFDATKAALERADVECYVTDRKRSVTAKDPGERVHVTLMYGPRGSVFYFVDPPRNKGVEGPYWSRDVVHGDGRLYDRRGDFSVAVKDDTRMLVVRTEPDDNEDAHRRTRARLRTFARSEGMRVRFEDREVRLIDPMNNTAWVGDVTSAFLWLAGINPHEVAA